MLPTSVLTILLLIAAISVTTKIVSLRQLQKIPDDNGRIEQLKDRAAFFVFVSIGLNVIIASILLYYFYYNLSIYGNPSL